MLQLILLKPINNLDELITVAKTIEEELSESFENNFC